MSIRPFVMPFRLSCAYLIYDADAALPHLNPRKRRRGGIFIYEKRDHCIISCNSLFIFLINANLLTLPYKGSLVRPVARFHHSLFEYSGGLLRTTNHEPRFFSRAEGYSRRCRQFESVAAQRHLNPRRPANCGLRGHQPLTLFFLSSRGRFRRPGRRTRCFGPGR